MIPQSVFVPGKNVYQLCVDQVIIMFVEPIPPRLGLACYRTKKWCEFRHSVFPAKNVITPFQYYTNFLGFAYLGQRRGAVPTLQSKPLQAATQATSTHEGGENEERSHMSLWCNEMRWGSGACSRLIKRHGLALTCVPRIGACLGLREFLYLCLLYLSISF